jgi:hypothetical protein
MPKIYVVDYIDEKGISVKSTRHEAAGDLMDLATDLLLSGKEFIGAEVLDVNHIKRTDALYLFDQEAPHKGKVPNPYSPDLLGKIVYVRRDYQQGDPD